MYYAIDYEKEITRVREIEYNVCYLDVLTKFTKGVWL